MEVVRNDAYAQIDLSFAPDKPGLMVRRIMYRLAMKETPVSPPRVGTTDHAVTAPTRNESLIQCTYWIRCITHDTFDAAAVCQFGYSPRGPLARMHRSLSCRAASEDSGQGLTPHGSGGFCAAVFGSTRSARSY
jgi:hypothetical protein